MTMTAQYCHTRKSYPDKWYRFGMAQIISAELGAYCLHDREQFCDCVIFISLSDSWHGASIKESLSINCSPCLGRVRMDTQALGCEL
jgi:hypothetical protein